MNIVQELGLKAVPGWLAIFFGLIEALHTLHKVVIFQANTRGRIQTEIPLRTSGMSRYRTGPQLFPVF